MKKQTRGDMKLVARIRTGFAACAWLFAASAQACAWYDAQCLANEAANATVNVANQAGGAITGGINQVGGAITGGANQAGGAIAWGANQAGGAIVGAGNQAVSTIIGAANQTGKFIAQTADYLGAKILDTFNQAVSMSADQVKAVERQAMRQAAKNFLPAINPLASCVASRYKSLTGAPKDALDRIKNALQKGATIDGSLKNDLQTVGRQFCMYDNLIKLAPDQIKNSHFGILVGVNANAGLGSGVAVGIAMNASDPNSAKPFLTTGLSVGAAFGAEAKIGVFWGPGIIEEELEGIELGGEISGAELAGLGVGFSWSLKVIEDTFTTSGLKRLGNNAMNIPSGFITGIAGMSPQDIPKVMLDVFGYMTAPMAKLLTDVLGPTYIPSITIYVAGGEEVEFAATEETTVFTDSLVDLAKVNTAAINNSVAQRKSAMQAASGQTLATRAAALPAAAPGVFKRCSGEGQNCNVSDTLSVAVYGADTRWTARTTAGTFACSNAAFGDPAPGSSKECRTTAASLMVRCAGENQTCNVPASGGPFAIAYGVDQRMLSKVVNQAALCSNGAFGSDPARGVNKACYYLPIAVAYPSGSPKVAPLKATAYNMPAVAMASSSSAGAVPSKSAAKCADESGQCATSKPSVVLFGVGQQWAVKESVGKSIACSNASFGVDPAPGKVKQCLAVAFEDLPVCAAESGTCNPTGPSFIAYGAVGSGIKAKLMGQGPSTCSNSVFGDPAPGVPKQCRIDRLPQ